MALKGNIKIISNFDDYWQELYATICETPQWLQECPLEPIPPIDMKTACIGKICLLWTSKEMETDQMIEEMEAKILVYVEVDDYFKEDNYV